MTAFIVNKKLVRKYLAGVVLALLLIAALAPVARAAPIDTGFEFVPEFVGDCESNWGPDLYCAVSLAIQNIVMGIVYIFGRLFSWLMSLFAHGVIWMISTIGIGIITHPAVSKGVGITMKLSNWIFVIAIITIAFATILRWHEYEARKMLPKLILAAILVNFSLLFAGLLLDISNVFTIFFINDGSGVSASSIGNAFSPQRFNVSPYYGDTKAETVYRIVEDPETKVKRRVANVKIVRGNPDQEIQVGKMWEQFFNLLPKAIFAVLATFIGMITLLATMIMALVRNIWIVFLLIVMPLVWALWVLPKFGDYWQKWWEKFLNWGVIYLPTLSFFLYLAVATARQTETTFKGMPALDGVTGGFLGTGTTAVIGAGDVVKGMSVGEALILLLIIVGLMIAGLKIAQNMGATGAGLGFNLATKGSKKLAMGFGKLAGKGVLAGGFAAASGGLALGGLAAGTGWGVFKGIRKFRGTEKERKAMKEDKALIAEMRGLGHTADADALQKDFDKQYGTKKTRLWSGAKEVGKGMGMGAFPALWAFNKARDGNAYGYATERLGRGAARLSFLPGMSAAAQFLGKTSAAQRVGVENAEKEYEGMSPEARKAMYAAASLKSGAHQAAALAVAEKNDELDAIPAGVLKKYATAAADFSPGTKRNKLDLLKAAAAHNPAHAPDITGETPTEAAQRAKTNAVEKWDEKTYLEFRNRLNDAQRKAFMAVSAKNFNVELGGLNKELNSPALMSISNELKNLADQISDERKKGSEMNLAVLDRLQENQMAAMRKLKVAIEGIDTTNMTPELRDSVETFKHMRRVVGSRGEKDEHPAHGYEDYTVRGMFSKFLKSAMEGGSGIKFGGGGGGHGPKH